MDDTFCVMYVWQLSFDFQFKIEIKIVNVNFDFCLNIEF